MDLARSTRAACMLAALLTTMTWAAEAQAGPWVKDPGQLYAKAGGSAFESDLVFDVDGELVDPGFTFSNRSINLYAEAGILPRVGLTLNLPVHFSTNELSERVRVRNQGAGDLDVGLQAQIKESGACPVSAHLIGRAPLYSGIVSDGSTPGTSGIAPSDDDPNGLALRYAPALGDGSVDVTGLVSVGCSLYPLPAWVTVEAGPQLRFRGFGDGVRWAADAGAFVWPERLALTVRVEGQQRLQTDNPRPTKNFIALGGGVILNLAAGFALEANGSYIPTGAFVARGWNVGAGVSFTGTVLKDPFTSASADQSAEE